MKAFKGDVEVRDQVQGLQELARLMDGRLDLDRVIVHGWSYGGYLSLRLLASHPEVDIIFRTKETSIRFIEVPLPEEQFMIGNSMTQLIRSGILDFQTKSATHIALLPNPLGNCQMNLGGFLFCTAYLMKMYTSDTQKL